MEEKKKFNKKLNIKVPPTILTNRELMDNEKLILSLDYTFSMKIGFNIMTNVDIGKVLSLHENIVGLCRKSLIKKGYLVKDIKDKRIHRLTDKLNSVELPIINNKIDKRECVLFFEIYNNSNLKTGEKLLWGEYNSMSKTEKGYFAKRETTAERMNVSVGSITNWTKGLSINGLLEEYEIKSEYYKKQKIVRTVEFKREKEIKNNDYDFDESAFKKDNFEVEEVNDVSFEAVDDISELYGIKHSENKILEEENVIQKEENKGGITKYSDLSIAKKGKKPNTDDDFEDFNGNYEDDDLL